MTVARAVAALARGGVVCFPTETWYGLAVDARSEAALARLAALKGREEGKTMGLIVPSLAAARELWASVPARPARQARIHELARAYWPGPLTLVARARDGLPAAIVGPGGGVAARVSSHPVAHALAVAFGGAITATSANRAGGEPARTVAAARAVFGDEVDVYLDGGESPGGPPSTVAAVDEDGGVRVLRVGAVPLPW